MIVCSKYELPVYKILITNSINNFNQKLKKNNKKMWDIKMEVI